MMTATKLKHPAQFTPAIVDLMVDRLNQAKIVGTILDPFAGPGMSLHRFVGPRRRVIGFEIEEPWVEYGNQAEVERIEKATDGLMHVEPMLECVDSTKIPMRAKSVAAIVTSVVYPNRMTDHHRARDTSERRSYTHDIRTMTGDPDYELAENNAGRMSGGLSEAYRTLHVRVLRECSRVAKPGALLLLNVSDSYANDEIISAVAWFIAACQQIGWEWRKADRVETPRMGRGQNGDKRVDGEWVLELRKP